jgi:hypothetical protein
VIYEHATPSVVAHGLVAEMKAMVTKLQEQGARLYDGEIAIALRAIEQGARTVRTSPDQKTAYLELMGTLLHGARAAEQASGPSAAGGSLIIPGA